MQMQFGEVSSLRGPTQVHPADVLGLAAGRIEHDPQAWEKLLKNVVALAKAGAVVGRQAVQEILRLLQEPVLIDSQEGECQGKDVPVKIIAQILHRILRTSTPNYDTTDALNIAEEHLELLQDLLHRPRHPIKRRAPRTTTTPRGEQSKQVDHVIKFMRRQTDSEALHAAAGARRTLRPFVRPPG